MGPVRIDGGAWVGLIVDDAALTPEWICHVLVPILLDPQLVAEMSAAAASLGSRDTDEWLAARVMDIMDGVP